MTAPMKDPPGAEGPPADVDLPLPLSPTPRVLVTSVPVVPGLAPRPFAGFEGALPAGAGPAAGPPGAGSAIASFGCSALAGVFLMGFVATGSHTSGVPRSHRLERLARERAVETCGQEPAPETRPDEAARDDAPR
jgi:hypothetical protein